MRYWLLPDQDLLALELRWSHRELPHPDRITVHRVGVPGREEEEPLAHELRCFPNTAQVRRSLHSHQGPAHATPCQGSLLTGKRLALSAASKKQQHSCCTYKNRTCVLPHILAACASLA